MYLLLYVCSDGDTQDQSLGHPKILLIVTVISFVYLKVYIVGHFYSSYTPIVAKRKTACKK
jgi:hypothetical protein